MDNLLEALKTGSAFNVRDKRDGRRRTPRAAGGWCFVSLFCCRGQCCQQHLVCALPRMERTTLIFRGTRFVGEWSLRPLLLLM